MYTCDNQNIVPMHSNTLLPPSSALVSNLYLNAQVAWLMNSAGMVGLFLTFVQYVFRKL